jgi:hypothetical protein
VGANVTGHAIWDPTHGGSDRAKEIRITLRWRTEGRGERASATVQFLRIPVAAGPPPAPTRFPFRFTLPPDGPVSYHGYLISVIWEIEARVDVSWAIDPKAVVPLTVVPRVVGSTPPL